MTTSDQADTSQQVLKSRFLAKTVETQRLAILEFLAGTLQFRQSIPV